MPLLPKGHRVDDPKELRGWAAVKFRLALAVRKYPVQITLVVALLIAAYPVWLVVSASHRLANANNDLRDAVVATTASRQASSRTYCEAIRNNTIAINRVTNYFVVTIERSLTDPAPGQHLTKEERKLTEDFLNGLKALGRTPLDCKRFQEQIERDVKRLQETG